MHILDSLLAFSAYFFIGVAMADHLCLFSTPKLQLA